MKETDFVAEILAADAADPEAEFDNVEDMLEWLDQPGLVWASRSGNDPPTPRPRTG